VGAGKFVQPAPRTLKSFLEDEWLPEVKPPRVRESTWSSYEEAVEFHIVPTLGHVNLQQLTSGHLAALYRHLLTNGRRDGKGGLKAKTVKNIHGVVHVALSLALRWATWPAMSPRPWTCRR
jgi:integrase